MNNPAAVSVIIPTSNSENFLDRCLGSIEKQHYPHFEIIVVDNYSKDNTWKIAKDYGCKIISSRTNRSNARNIGFCSARGGYILSIDSDMELTEDVIIESLRKLKAGFQAIIIPEISVGEGFWTKCKVLERSCYVGDDSIEAPRFFEKSVIDVINGYDTDLVFGEDWDLSLRIRQRGFKIGRINAHINHNEGRLTLQQAILKKRYYGETLQNYAAKHPREARQQLSPFRSAFLKNWRRLAGNPFCAFGMVLMKTCEFSAAWLATKTDASC